MRARFKLGQRCVGRWLVQVFDALCKRGELVFLQHRGRQRILQIANAERAADQLAQWLLAETGSGGIHRGEVFFERHALTHHAYLRMHHFRPEKTRTQLAQQTYPCALTQYFLLTGIEVQQPHKHLAARILHPTHQLAARTKTHLGMRHHPFDLC